MANLPLGVRLNNPGCIDRVKGVRWQGEADVQKHKRHVTYKGPEWGVRAICRILITYQDKRKARDGSKIDTIREIIDRWAPATENNTAAYIGHVSQLTGIGADETVDVYRYEVMRPLVEAIIAHECAGYRYPESVINEGLRLAGIKVPLSPLDESRTIKAAKYAAGPGAALSLIATAAPDIIGEVRSTIMEILPYFQAAKYVLLILTIIGIGVMVWARIDDGRKARR